MIEVPKFRKSLRYAIHGLVILVRSENNVSAATQLAQDRVSGGATLKHSESHK